MDVPMTRAECAQILREFAVECGHHNIGWGEHTTHGILADAYFPRETFLFPDIAHLLSRLPLHIRSSVRIVLSMEGESLIAVETAAQLERAFSHSVRILRVHRDPKTGDSFIKEFDKGASIQKESKTLIVGSNAIGIGKNLRPLFHSIRYADGMPVAIGVILDRRQERTPTCLGLPFASVYGLEDLAPHGIGSPVTMRVSRCSLCKSDIALSEGGVF